MERQREQGAIARAGTSLEDPICKAPSFDMNSQGLFQSDPKLPFVESGIGLDLRYGNSTDIRGKRPRSNSFDVDASSRGFKHTKKETTGLRNDIASESHAPFAKIHEIPRKIGSSSQHDGLRLPHEHPARDML